MSRRPWLPLAVAVYSACLAGAWLLERRARVAAEAEVARLSARAKRPAARAGKPAPVVPVHEELPTSAEPPVVVPSPAAPVAEAPPETRLVRHPAEPEPATRVKSPLESEFDVNELDPVGEFARILALWHRVSSDPQNLEFRNGSAWKFFRKALDRLMQLGKERLIEPLASALREEPVDAMLTPKLLSMMVELDKGRAAQALRDALDLAKPDSYRTLVRFLHYLPSDQAESYWRRGLADADAEVRYLAAMNPPGEGPEYEEPMRNIALHESDPERRGEALGDLFELNSSPANLDLIVHELERDRTPAFQTGVLESIDRKLTSRDTEMIRVLRALARDASGDKDVRIEATRILNGSYGDPLVPPAEVEQWEALESKLQDQE